MSVSRWLGLVFLSSVLVVGCHSRPEPSSSPDALIAAYREYSIASDAEGLWSLFADEHRARFSGGIESLKSSRNSRVADVEVYAKSTLGDSAMYRVITVYSKEDPIQKGGRIGSRVRMAKQQGRWRIALIESDLE